MSLKTDMQNGRLLRATFYFLIVLLGVLAYFLLVMPEPYRAPEAFMFEQGSIATMLIGCIMSFLGTALAYWVTKELAGNLALRMAISSFICTALFCFGLAFTLDRHFLATELDYARLAGRTALVAVAIWAIGLAPLAIPIAIKTLLAPKKDVAQNKPETL